MKLNKKGRVILFVGIAVALSGIGVGLAWYLQQADNVSTTESEAGPLTNDDGSSVTDPNPDSDVDLGLNCIFVVLFGSVI